MAGKKPILNTTGPAVLFKMPSIQGRFYAPGLQPNNPGESQITDIGAGKFHRVPWPNVVQSLKTLASNGGTPHARGMQQVNNAEAPLLQNYLFIAGVAQKSRG